MIYCCDKKLESGDVSLKCYKISLTITCNRLNWRKIHFSWRDKLTCIVQISKWIVNLLHNIVIITLNILHSHLKFFYSKESLSFHNSHRKNTTKLFFYLILIFQWCRKLFTLNFKAILLLPVTKNMYLLMQMRRIWNFFSFHFFLYFFVHFRLPKRRRNLPEIFFHAIYSPKMKLYSNQQRTTDYTRNFLFSPYSTSFVESFTYR